MSLTCFGDLRGIESRVCASLLGSSLVLRGVEIEVEICGARVWSVCGVRVCACARQPPSDTMGRRPD